MKVKCNVQETVSHENWFAGLESEENEGVIGESIATKEETVNPVTRVDGILHVANPLFEIKMKM